MSSGMSQNFRCRTGFTMVEVLVSVLLLVVIFMAIAALQVGGHRLFLTAKDKVVVGYELQYALEHIYEHVFTGKGDLSAPAIDIVSSTEFTLTYINKTTKAERTSRYEITDAGVLGFDQDADLTFDEYLGSAVTFIKSESEFSMSGNLFRVKLTAEFPLARAGEAPQRLTLYGASYPRCASFQ